MNRVTATIILLFSLLASTVPTATAQGGPFYSLQEDFENQANGNTPITTTFYYVWKDMQLGNPGAHTLCNGYYDDFANIPSDSKVQNGGPGSSTHDLRAGPYEKAYNQLTPTRADCDGIDYYSGFQFGSSMHIDTPTSVEFDMAVNFAYDNNAANHNTGSSTTILMGNENVNLGGAPFDGTCASSRGIECGSPFLWDIEVNGGVSEGCNIGNQHVLNNDVFFHHYKVTFDWFQHMETYFLDGGFLDTCQFYGERAGGPTEGTHWTFFGLDHQQNTPSVQLDNLVIQGTAPQIPSGMSITSPTTGQQFSVGATVSFDATVNDPDHQAASMKFLANKGFPSTVICTLPPTSPFHCTKQFLQADIGNWQLDAKVYDSSGLVLDSYSADHGNPVFFTINGIPMTITSPSNGAHYGAGVSIHFATTVNDPNHQIDQIEFKGQRNNGAMEDICLPATTFCDVPLDSGAWTNIHAEAFDSSGQTLGSSNNVAITVGNVLSGNDIVTSRVFNGIVGMDVNPAGNTVIIRTGRDTNQTGGDYVRTLDANTVTGTSNMETKCNRIHGVSSISGYVAFWSCLDQSSNGGLSENPPAVVSALSIRSPSLGAPTVPEICTQGSFCDSDILTVCTPCGQLAGDDNKMIHLTTVQQFPYDFTVNARDNCGTCANDDHVFTAFAVADTDGNVGVVTYAWINNQVDQSDIKLVPISAIRQVADSLCTVRDTDDTQYLYASSSVSNAMGFRVEFETHPQSIFESPAIDVKSITTSFPGTSTTSNAEGIGCGQGTFAILTSGNLYLFKRGETAPYQTISGLTGVVAGGIAESYNGKWVGYIAGGRLHIAGMDNATEFENAPLPTGTFVSMHMQGAGCTAWIATNQVVSRYRLHDVCPIDKGFIENPGDICIANGGTSGSCNGTTVTKTTVGVVAGSGCGDHYDGEIRIGFTYVPISDWSNCASMATETVITIVMLIAVVYLVSFFFGGEPGKWANVSMSSLGYVASIYVWQAPVLPLIVLGIGAIALIFVMRGRGGGD